MQTRPSTLMVLSTSPPRIKLNAMMTISLSCRKVMPRCSVRCIKDSGERSGAGSASPSCLSAPFFALAIFPPFLRTCPSVRSCSDAFRVAGTFVCSHYYRGWQKKRNTSPSDFLRLGGKWTFCILKIKNTSQKLMNFLVAKLSTFSSIFLIAIAWSMLSHHRYDYV